MDKERQELFRSLGFLSSVGICMVASIVIGLAMGYYLDKWLNTAPWLTLIFMVLGIVSGFRNIFILTNRELKRQKRQADTSSDHDQH